VAEQVEQLQESRRRRNRRADQAVDETTGERQAYIGAQVYLYRGVIGKGDIGAPDPKPCVAFITDIKDDGTTVNLAFFTPGGGHFDKKSVPFSPAPRCWHWTWMTAKE